VLRTRGQVFDVIDLTISAAKSFSISFAITHAEARAFQPDTQHPRTSKQLNRAESGTHGHATNLRSVNVPPVIRAAYSPSAAMSSARWAPMTW